MDINLSNMNINDQRLRECFEHIRANRHLKSINFSHNKITSNGFAELLKVAGKHPSLDTIYLNNNLLSEKAVSLVKRKVGQLGKLRYIALRNNHQISHVERFKETISFLKKHKLRLDLK